MFYWLWLELHSFWHRKYIKRTGERTIRKYYISYERECSKCKTFTLQETFWYL